MKGFKRWMGVGALVMLLSACGNSETTATKEISAEEPESEVTVPILKMGYATSIMSYPMTLLPDYTENLEVELSSFSSGNDVMTALISKSIDVAQITYLHYITAMDKGLDIVPISGQVNGGTDMLIHKSLELEPDDWDGLKKLIAEYKEQGKTFRVAASRGSAQDIQMRGEFLLHGIDPMKDVEIINIANVSDHVTALERGEVEMTTSVEPVATMAKINGAAKHFAYPYNQDAGNLTNLIVTRSDVIEDRPKDLTAIVGGIVSVLDEIDSDKDLWIDVVNEYTTLDDETGSEALKNAYPDHKIHRESALAIVSMMQELNYIQSDVSDKVGANINYTFLSEVTGKPKEELGYND